MNEKKDEKKYTEADVETMLKPMTAQLNKMAQQIADIKDGGKKPMLLTTVNCVPIEALGKRTTLRGMKNGTKFVFVERDGYKFPVCDIPKEMADKIIAADTRDQDEADERITTVNAKRIDDAENADIQLKAQGKFKQKSKAVSPLEVANILNFRYAVKEAEEAKRNAAVEKAKAKQEKQIADEKVESE